MKTLFDLTENARFLIQNKLNVLGGQIRNLQSRIEFLKRECSQELDVYKYAEDIIETSTRPRLGMGRFRKVQVKVSSLRMAFTLPREVSAQSYCGAWFRGSTRSSVTST